MKKKHKKRSSGKNCRNSSHNSNTVQNTQNTGSVNSNNGNNGDNSTNGTNSNDANSQAKVTPSIPPPVQERPEIPQPIAAKEGIPPLQSLQPQGNKKTTKSPKRMSKLLSSIKCSIKFFFNKIKKGLSVFGNNILRKPKPPKNPEPLRNPTKKAVVPQYIDKWMDPTKKLWKRLMWRLYDDICESFWKFFAYEIAIIATTFTVLSYLYLIPIIMKSYITP